VITVTLIAAVARNGVIGHDGALPWHLPQDLAHLKARTVGRTVLMGRATWDSLPPRFRPLPNRRNLVLSTRSDWQPDGATLVRSLDEALGLVAANAGSELVVIGGSQVYALALPRADELVLTEIDADVDGDAHFPAWSHDDFVEVSRETHRTAEGLGFAFVVYQRRPV
jgi:dihydrofolate reductase